MSLALAFAFLISFKLFSISSRFSILTAIKACQDHGCLMPRLCCLFEGAEESTDEDLNYYFDKLVPLMGEVCAFIPLDSGCGT